MKRIIICSDGIWDKSANENNNGLIRSNVQKMFRVIAKSGADGIKQIKHYDNGAISTGGFLKRIVNGTIGMGLDASIIKAYKFIVWNYEPGDEIYLFGFSRGAYIVRSLVGLIRNCGVLRNQDLHMVQEAYDFYRDPFPGTHPNSYRAHTFIDENSYRAPIKFIGVWDTVGELGIPLNKFGFHNLEKYRFHDLKLSSIVQHAYQAIAVDERRPLLGTNLWEKSETAMRKHIKQFVEQVWFAGVHENVGGCYHDERLSDLPLQWMIEKAVIAGLSIDRDAITAHFPAFLDPCEKGAMYQSKKWSNRFNKDNVRLVGEPKFRNQFIHPSVFERIRECPGYNPVNVPRGLESYEVPVLESKRPLMMAGNEAASA